MTADHRSTVRLRRLIGGGVGAPPRNERTIQGLKLGELNALAQILRTSSRAIAGMGADDVKAMELNARATLLDEVHNLQQIVHNTIEGMEP